MTEIVELKKIARILIGIQFGLFGLTLIAYGRTTYSSEIFLIGMLFAVVGVGVSGFAAVWGVVESLNTV